GFFERNPNDDVHRTQRIPKVVPSGSGPLPAQPTARHFDPRNIPNLTLEHLAAIDAGTFELGGTDTDENPSFSNNGAHPSAESDNPEGPTKHPLGPLFISHSRNHNPEFTRQIYQMLQEEGIDVWLDTESLEIGVNWDQSIEDAMNSSWGGLILVSRQSIKSLRCAAERQ